MKYHSLNDEIVAEASKSVEGICRILATLAEMELDRCTHNARGAAMNLISIWESLRSRAREAPTLNATVGASGLIVFYASKASEIQESILNAMLASISRPSKAKLLRRSLCRKKIDATAAGYAIYLAALLRTINGETKTGFINLVKTTLDNLAWGRVRYSILRYKVETLSRLIEVYTTPVFLESQDYIRKNEYYKLIYHVAKECRGGENDDQETL